MAQIDDKNPFAALVSQAPKTVLDSHRESIQKHNDPVIVFDSHSPDEDVPIQLQYKQPSFSSLEDENLRTKDDQTIDHFRHPATDPNKDPLIAFDSKGASDRDDSCQAIPSIHQPSGTRFSPQPAPLESIAQDDPQVQLLQELHARNRQRWQRLGYEPPPDCIQLVRAASQAQIRQTPAIYSVTPTNLESGKCTAPNLVRNWHSAILEDKILAPVKEATIDKSDRLGNMTERLFALVDKEWLREVLATGDVRLHQPVEELKAELKKLADITANKFWIEETEYIHSLLSNTVLLSPKTTRKLGFVRADVDADIERMEQELQDLETERERRAEELQRNKEKALQELEQEYLETAKGLDDLYETPEYLQSLVKPSNTLLNLRERTRRMLQANRADDARELTWDVEMAEQRETERARVTVQDDYCLKDQNMKEEFASRREIILEKHQYILDLLNSEIDRKADIIRNQIAKLRAQFTPADGDESGKITTATMKKGTQTCNFLDTGCLRVSPPQLRNRSEDIKLIAEMSVAMHEQRSPRRGYNDQKLKL